MCDDTQNLNETESKTFSETKFFWYRMFLTPNPILSLPILIPNCTQPCLKQTIPRFCWICFFVTESETFYTKYFRYRIRYFFGYQICSILNLIFFATKFFRYWIRYHPKNRKSLETETFWNREVLKPKCHTLPGCRVSASWRWR